MLVDLYWGACVLKGTVVSKCGFVRRWGCLERGSLRARVSWAGTGAWRLGAWAEGAGPLLVPEGPKVVAVVVGLQRPGQEDRAGPGMAGAPAGDEAPRKDRKDTQSAVNILHCPAKHLCSMQFNSTPVY